MPKFELSWKSSGTAEVEADDLDEAKEILTDSLDRWDTFALNWMDVDLIEVKE